MLVARNVGTEQGRPFFVLYGFGADASMQAEQAERIRQAGSIADLWRQGGPHHYLLNAIPPILRIKGHEVQTSHGASFPITHAKKGLALVKAVMAKGEDWNSNGRACKLGCYQISHISKEGTVRAGCHLVVWPEIERIAGSIEAYVPRIKCNHCIMLSINGVACHETGCSNSRKIWSAEEDDWI